MTNSMRIAEPGERRTPDVSERAIELRVSATVENLVAVRAVVAAIAASEDLDFDTVADLRLAVDEACTALIRASLPGADLELVIDPGPEAFVVRACTTRSAGNVVEPGGFSWHVMKSLVDEVGAIPVFDGAPAGIRLLMRRMSSYR